MSFSFWKNDFALDLERKHCISYGSLTLSNPRDMRCEAEGIAWQNRCAQKRADREAAFQARCACQREQREREWQEKQTAYAQQRQREAEWRANCRTSAYSEPGDAATPTTTKRAMKPRKIISGAEAIAKQAAKITGETRKGGSHINQRQLKKLQMQATKHFQRPDGKRS